MRRLMCLLAVLFVAGLASSAMADVATVQFDLSAAYNYDGYVTQAEADHAKLYDPPGDWGLSDRQVMNVFGDHASVPKTCPAWDGQKTAGVGIPTDGIITTAWGTFALSTDLDDSDNIPAEALPPPDSPKGSLPLVLNTIRACDAATGGTMIRSVSLAAGDRGQYESINFIMVGNGDQSGVTRFYANYEGEGEGINGEKIWESPLVGAKTKTGVPLMTAATTDQPDIVSALFAEDLWVKLSNYTIIRSGKTSNLWTFEEGLLLNPGKTLVGFTAQTTNAAQRLTIYAVSAQPPSGTAFMGTVDALPDTIGDDGGYPSIVTIELQDDVGDPASGHAADLTVEKSSGTGTAAIGTVTEPDPAGNPGVYEVEVTGTLTGDVELSVYIYKGDPEELLIGTDTVTVFTPGVDDYPLADAGDDVEVEDSDDDSREEVTLDASDSHDDTGITNYLWQEGTQTVYNGPDDVVVQDFLLGVHDLTLTVSDADGHYHMDFVTITVTPPADDATVCFDLSAAWNYDGYVSVAEAEHAKLYNPPGDWSLGNRQVMSVFGDHSLVPKTCPVWEGQSTYGVGIPACGLINTSWGVFALSTDIDSPDIPAEALPKPDSPLGLLPVVPNVLRLCDGAAGGALIRSVMLAAGDCGQYESINFIMVGNGLQNGLTRLYANYEGEGEGTAGTLLWESPPVGDPAKYGVPLMTEDDSSVPEIVSALSSDDVWQGIGDYTAVRPNLSNLWTFDEGLDLDPGKTLVGFTGETTTNLHRLVVYAVSAQPASALPLEITAEVTAGEEWVYQNTETTTDDRHISTATITLVSEASPGEVYDISIADDGPPGANFTLGDVTDNRLVDDTMVVEIVGGRTDASTIGVGGAAYNVTLTVEGQDSEESDSAQVQVSLLRIGDINRDGSLTGTDRQLFNQRLNNVATVYTDRTFDLDGSGGAPTGTDKQVMNQALNNVPLP